MKIKYQDNDNFILYLNKFYINKLDLEDKKSVEEYFKNIFLKLKKRFSFNIYGYYNIKVFANNIYGIIIEVNKINNEYFKLYGSKTDMKIAIDTNNLFLYEIEDYFLIDYLSDYINNIYYNDNNHKYYIEINENINKAKYNILIENSNIIYDADADDILFSCSLL